jgi:hypothetical protein
MLIIRGGDIKLFIGVVKKKVQIYWSLKMLIFAVIFGWFSNLPKNKVNVPKNSQYFCS